MRIIHFINNINLSWYGMFTDTVKAQRRRGHEVWTVFPPGGVNYKRMRGDGLPVIPLSVRSSKFDYFAAWRLSRLLRELKIDVLHTHLTSSALLGSAAARWAGIPCAASVLKMTSVRRYMKCSMLLPCSDAVMEDLLRQGAPRAKMRRIYTGIDVEKFLSEFGARRDLRGEFGFGADEKILGIVARLVPMKGHSALLDAMPGVIERHPAARLLVVGDGELRGTLERRAAELNIKEKIVFAGTRADLPDVLGAIDVSVMASVEKEGLPVALVQSCLAGRPAVATDVAGIREVVRDGETGFLAPAGDPEALAAAIIKMLDDPAEARRMALAAREWVVREFDVNRTAAQMDEVYTALAGAVAR